MMKNIYYIIPKINVALILSGFVLGGYLLFAMSRPYLVVSLVSKQVSMPSLESVVKKTLDGVPPLSKGIFKNSELFRSSGKKAVSQEARVFALVGISMGEKKLAIIRDTKANKNYYCTEGDIAGDYTIKEITKDKVVLEFEGNLLEITR
jgi:type II secretory pathway component PulC